MDIGGTFTDLVLGLPDGSLRVGKVPSTPDDPGRAVVLGLADLLARAGVAPADVVEVVHGTTVASNTVLQKRGARTGLLATRGFRDVLEIGRVRMPELYDLTWVKPEPLVERRFRLEVDERMAADGSVVRPLDREGLLAAAGRLVAGGAGGQPARGARNVLNPDGEARSMPAKFALLLRQGDSILHEQPGGGGFGDPLERDPDRVAADVRNERITPAFALREHGVAVAPDTGEVDRAATLALRAERRRPAGPEAPPG